MSTAIAVARREMRTFFNSPIAYIVLCGFLLLAGWLFFSTLFLGGRPRCAASSGSPRCSSSSSHPR